MLEGKYFNIDKINCIVQKNIQVESKVYNTKGSPKVIYKPIFYRTYDLQNIQLRIGLVQNVGINLSDYMTNVEAFKMSIAGQEYMEFARNDVYVLFKIDASKLIESTGVYHILDNDGNYISTGEWRLLET